MSKATDCNHFRHRGRLPGRASSAPVIAWDATTSNVAGQLRQRIIEGDYAYEERLPAERNLAQEFGVSRGTIRSVLQILEKQNMVERQIGSGTYVTHRETTNQQEITSLTSPVEMNEVRIAIEPQMVRLAIANASSRELDELRQALRQCEECDPTQRSLRVPIPLSTWRWRVARAIN